MSVAPTAARLEQADRELLVDAVRKFARQELIPSAPLLDRGDPARFARCWGQVCELGLDRALLPEDAGGTDLPPGAWLAVVEELAVAEGGLALAVALSNLALLALPAEDLARAPSGCRWALVPAAGVALNGSDRDVHGTIGGALGAVGADGIVLLARDADVAAALAGGDAGWSVAPDERQLGLRAARAGDVRLDAARPTTVRETADGTEIAALRPLLLAAVAAIAMGISRRAYELALDYAAARRQGGNPIGSYGAVRQMLAGMAIGLRARPCTPYDADAPAIGDGGLLAATLAAKVAASEAAAQTTIDAVQIFGGSGYMRDSGVEKLMRDAKYCQLYPEPNWRARAQLVALEPGLPPATEP